MTPIVQAILLACAVLPAGAVAADLEFSAEQTTRVGTKSMTGKIFFQPDRWRVEMAGQEGPRVSINRLDKGITWLLLPNRTYVEIPLRLDQIPRVAPKIEGEVKRKRVGVEQVGGRMTEKYEVTVEIKGRKEVIYQWVAADIKFPMKTASIDGKWESVYNFVTLAPQKADLFELPAGYTKAPTQP
jgi:hypothetical protein